MCSQAGEVRLASLAAAKQLAGMWRDRVVQSTNENEADINMYRSAALRSRLQPMCSEVLGRRRQEAAACMIRRAFGKCMLPARDMQEGGVK